MLGGLDMSPASAYIGTTPTDTAMSFPLFPSLPLSDAAFEARDLARREERRRRIDAVRALCAEIAKLDGVESACYEDSTNDYFDVDVNVFLTTVDQPYGRRPPVGGWIIAADLRRLSREVRKVALAHGCENVTVRSPRKESGFITHAERVMNLNFLSIDT